MVEMDDTPRDTLTPVREQFQVTTSSTTHPHIVLTGAEHDSTSVVPMARWKQSVAFDVDGCLIESNDQPRWQVIDLLRAFDAMGWHIIVWSGGGVDYCWMWVRRLGLFSMVDEVIRKGAERVDVCFDDENVDLGDANVRV